MKRSPYVQISLAASVALAIAGCGQNEKTVHVKESYNFKTVQECTTQKFPVDVCSDAYITAMAEHRRNAPTYDTQADCDADFVAGYCQADSSGRFIPQLGGFQLGAEGEVTQAQLDAARAQAQSGGGGGGFSTGSLLTGLLIGNLLSSNRGGYYSAPVYNYRDGRGGFSTSTLRQRMDTTNGAFSRARSSSSGGGFSTSNSRPISVSSSTSRGGFGSKASARSGWGGSSGGSFGG